MSTATAPAPAQTRAITRGDEGIRGLIEAAKPKIREVLARHMDSDRFVRMCIFNITRNPTLMRCDPMSLLECVMTSAELGVHLGGSLGEAYPVPYGDKATFILGYRGMARMARRSGEIARTSAQVVREGDSFEYELGLEPKLRHVPTADATAQITHAYAIAWYKDGSSQFDVMTFSEIKAIQNRSRAGRNGPWVTDFAEMAKKTVFRRLAKWLPLTSEAVEAMERSDRAEFGEFIEGQVVNTADKTAQDITAKLGGNGKAASQPVSTEQPAEQESPPSDESSEAPAPPEESQEPSAHEKLVIMLAEKCECDAAKARSRLERACKVFGRGLHQLSAKQLGELEAKIRDGAIVID